MSISIANNSTQTLAETHEQDANRGVCAPPPDSQSSKKADLAGPGIGDYNELEKILPTDYNPLLNPKETQQAIFQVKRYIEDNLCKELSLMMVEVPLIVDAESGVNDMLDHPRFPHSHSVPHFQRPRQTSDRRPGSPGRHKMEKDGSEAV